MFKNVSVLTTIFFFIVCGVVCAGALEIGEKSENAYGIEGFNLTRVPVPDAGWWPRELEFYEYTYKDDKVDMNGVMLKPSGEGAFSGAVINHGGGGFAREWGFEYGWHC